MTKTHNDKKETSVTTIAGNGVSRTAFRFLLRAAKLCGAIFGPSLTSLKPGQLDSSSWDLRRNIKRKQDETDFHKMVCFHLFSILKSLSPLSLTVNVSG